MGERNSKVRVNPTAAKIQPMFSSYHPNILIKLFNRKIKGRKYSFYLYSTGTL